MTEGVSRRDLLKGVAAAGTATVILGLTDLEGLPVQLVEEAWAQSATGKVNVERWVPSVCPYCSVGCAILYGVRDGRIVVVRGDPEGWNKGRMCVKGSSLADLYIPGSPGQRDRLTKPLLRLDPRRRGTFDGFREVTWDEALDFIVSKAKEYARLSAGDKCAFGVYGSGQVSLEEEYLQHKVFVLGLNAHSDNNGRLCQPTMVMGMVISWGIDGPPMSYDDVYHADNLFLFGVNMADALPVWFGKVVDAKTRKGADLRIVVVDPVKTTAAQIIDEERGDRWVPIMPGTDVLLINSMAYVILYELEGLGLPPYNGNADAWLEDVKAGKAKPRYVDVDFIERYTSFFRGDYGVLSRLAKEGPAVFAEIALGDGLKGFAEYVRFIAKFKPEDVADTCGLDPATIRRAAEAFVRGRNTMSVYLQGFGQYSNGVSKHLALATLHAVTGRIGRKGAGVMPTVGQPNGLGQRIGGAVVGRLPGNRNHPVPAHRVSFAKALAKGDPLMEQKILERIEMVAPDGRRVSRLAYTAVDFFRSVAKGEVKGVWITCTNPLVSFPNVNAVVEALERAELVVVQDIYVTETVAFADVVLPAASLSGESTGTFVNTERRVQLLEKAVEPPGDALPDEVIYLAFAYKMAKALRTEGRAEEADFLELMVKPFISGYEHLLENVQANVARLREAHAEIQARVFAELAEVSKGVPSNDFSGLSYERLREERGARGCRGFQIPVPSPTHNGTERLYDEEYEKVYGTRFALPRMRCFLWDYVPPAEWPDAEYPFILTLPRIYEHWHTRTRTGRCLAPMKLAPEPWVSLNPKDAERLGVRDGDLVEVISRRGRVVARAKVDVVRIPREGVVWMPWAYGFMLDLIRGRFEDPPGTANANLLSNDAYDPVSKQPELKLTAVRLRRLVR